MIFLLGLLLSSLFLVGHASASYPNTVYIISNAEVPSLGLPGLSPIGEQRATECLPKFFGANSTYNIGLIISCTPDERSGDCLTPIMTITPLAQSLGLTVNTTCGIKDDGSDCVENTIEAFAATSSKDVLICWQLNDIDNLTDALDTNNTPDFPKSHYDVYFTFRKGDYIAEGSQGCPGIDGATSGSSA